MRLRGGYYAAARGGTGGRSAAGAEGARAFGELGNLEYAVSLWVELLDEADSRRGGSPGPAQEQQTQEAIRCRISVWKRHGGGGVTVQVHRGVVAAGG